MGNHKCERGDAVIHVNKNAINSPAVERFLQIFPEIRLQEAYPFANFIESFPITGEMNSIPRFVREPEFREIDPSGSRTPQFTPEKRVSLSWNPHELKHQIKESDTNASKIRQAVLISNEIAAFPERLPFDVVYEELLNEQTANISLGSFDGNLVSILSSCNRDTEDRGQNNAKTVIWNHQKMAAISNACGSFSGNQLLFVARAGEVSVHYQDEQTIGMDNKILKSSVSQSGQTSTFDRGMNKWVVQFPNLISCNQKAIKEDSAPVFAFDSECVYLATSEDKRQMVIDIYKNWGEDIIQFRATMYIGVTVDEPKKIIRIENV